MQNIYLTDSASLIAAYIELNFVGKISVFAVPQCVNEGLPCSRLPFTLQPLLQDRSNDFLCLLTAVIHNNVHLTSGFIIQKEDPKLFVVDTNNLWYVKFQEIR